MRQMVAPSLRSHAVATGPGQAREAKQRRASCDAKTSRNQQKPIRSPVDETHLSGLFDAIETVFSPRGAADGTGKLDSSRPPVMAGALRSAFRVLA